MRCPRPVNPLVLLKARGLYGPFYQPVSGATCLKSLGNAFSPGGPLSSPHPTIGTVDTANTVSLSFSTCIEAAASPCANPQGVSASINGSPATVTGVSVLDTEMTIIVSDTIMAGDVVTVSYDDSGGCFVDCSQQEPIGSFTNYPVSNNLVLSGDIMMMESGGADVLLLEDALDMLSGLEFEDAA